MNLNKVFVLGNLTRDPELRQTQSGQMVATFGIATNRNWTDKTGNKQTAAEFHNIVLWGRLAEIAKAYLNRGSLVLIEGRLATRNWEDQSGNKRNRTEIIAENMQLGPRPLREQRPAPETNRPSSEAAPNIPEIQLEETPSAEEIKVEDIPF